MHLLPSSPSINKTEKSFGLHASCTAIRDTSSALEFMKVWRQKKIPTHTYPITGVELRRSPIPVLTVLAYLNIINSISNSQNV